MSEYSDAIKQQRQAQQRREAEFTGRMLKAYDDLIDSLEGDLRDITEQIVEARANGEAIHPDWLRRQSRYARLIDQARLSSDTFMALGTNIINDVHGSELERGAVDALERMNLLMGNAGPIAALDRDVFSGQINVQALENLVFQTSPTSPLMKVLESHGTGAAEIITSGLVSGTSGKGADEIYRSIRRQLQSPVADSRLMALVRTEMMNSYRASMHQQYQQFDDEIDGWMWSAHRGPRTCLACLAMDGQVFPMDQPFTQAHVCCRCSASPWPKDLYPEVRAFLQQQGSGEDWIRRQPLETRRKMFPSKDAFEAFERGDLSLMDFVGYTDSPVWGRKIHAVSGRQAMARRGVVPPGSGGSAPPREFFQDVDLSTYAFDQPEDVREWASPFAGKWKSDLTKAEREAIDFYAGDGFDEINHRLRKGTYSPDSLISADEQQSSISAIDTALTKTSLPAPVVVYRGASKSAFTGQPSPGDIVTDNGFMSTSLDPRTARKFHTIAENRNAGSGYLMRIEVPQGTNAAYLDVLQDEGSLSWESEILLPRNTTMVVKSVSTSSDGIRVVELEVVP